MPNQRDIARVLGVNQATISLALRGDHSISPAMQRRVRETAERLGYRPNAYVSSLMAHIRAGRKPSEEGVIALVVETRSEEEWHRMESYRIFHAGVTERAAALGFRVECFFLGAPGMSAGILDRILEARGIQGVIFAPPYRGTIPVSLRWERYACVGIGHGRGEQQFDRVANDHPRNVQLAFAELTRLGYQRIGVLMGGAASAGERGLKWFTGFLEAQHWLEPVRRIPNFAGDLEHGGQPAFKRWLREHRPDVLVTLTGLPKQTLEELKLRVPEEVALACLVRPRGADYAGVDEKNEIIGATALELVASQIARNEYGLPVHPKLTLIDGRWVDGPSAPAHRDEALPGCLPPKRRSSYRKSSPKPLLK